MNTADGENMEQLGATTEAVTGDPDVQTDNERGPDESPDASQAAQRTETTVTETPDERVTETTTESVVGRRDEDLPTENLSVPSAGGEDNSDS